MKKKLKVLDLFAGAGGLGLGFEDAGFDVVGAVEIDRWCCDTLEFNNPDTKVICKDITKITNDEFIKEFKGVDIIVGGPPCQGFSISNTKNGRDPKDPRNSLFKEFLRAISVLQPKAVVMENVKGLTTFKTQSGERVVDIIEKSLQELGYTVQTNILFAADYGVPQMRERVFIIGIKGATLKNKGFAPKKTHASADNLSGLKPYVTAWEAISDLPKIIDPISDDQFLDYDTPYQNQFQREMRLRSKNIYNHSPMRHSKKIIERLKHIINAGDKRNIPRELMPLIRNGNGAISEVIYDQNHRRIEPDQICYTIAASFYANFIHPYLPRNITPREGARIQSFPDRYIFKGKKTVVSSKLLEKEGRHTENYLSQYNQIGNAVPPLLARAVAKEIISHLN